MANPPSLRAPSPRRPLAAAPIFRAPHATWRIDSCRPQMAAVAAGKIALHALSGGDYPGEPLRDLPGVSSVGHWTALTDQDWGLEPHRNEGVELCFLESGHMDLEVDGAWHVLKPGALTVTRPWQLHRLGRPNIGAGRLHWLILDVGVRRPNAAWRWPSWVVLDAVDCAELSERLLGLGQPLLSASPELRATFARLATAVLRRPVSRSLMAVLLNELLWGLLEVLRGGAVPRLGRGDSHEHTVRLFLADLAAHLPLLRRPWTVKAMAGECGLGVTAFTALAHACVGLSPMAFLAAKRLEAAAGLLQAKPDMSITAVADECGFSSSQYFATRFRRAYGCMPRDWRLRVG